MATLSHSASGRANRQRGFTLLEVLITITLLGLILMLLYGGMRLGLRAWESNTARIDEMSQIEISHRFVRRMLGQAYPLAELDDLSGSAEGRAFVFKGAPDGVTFAGLMPARRGGGFRRFALALDGPRLVLRWRPMTEGADDSQENESVLIEGITSAAFSYFGTSVSGAIPRWRDGWDDVSSLPDLVRLEIEFPEAAGRFWPVLIVAPRIGVIGEE